MGRHEPVGVPREDAECCHDHVSTWVAVSFTPSLAHSAELWWAWVCGDTNLSTRLAGSTRSRAPLSVRLPAPLIPSMRGSGDIPKHMTRDIMQFFATSSSACKARG